MFQGTVSVCFFYRSMNSVCLKSINQAGDNKSVKMLNNFREPCMFDHSSILVGSTQILLSLKSRKEKRGKVGWRGAAPLAVPPALPRRPYCVSERIEQLALRQAGLHGVQIYRVSVTALFHSQVTACSSQRGGRGHVYPTAGWLNASLVFWL